MVGTLRFAHPTVAIRTTGNLRIRAMHRLPVVPSCRRGIVLIFRNELDLDPKSVFHSRHPASMKRGVSRSSRHVRRGCDGRGSVAHDCSCGRTVLMRTAKSCGPGLPTLRPSRCGDEPRWRRGQESPGPGESAKETVKTIAQGMPDDLADPVVTAASFFTCWRAMGEAFTRHSLHPLSFEGAFGQQLGRNSRRETADAYLEASSLRANRLTAAGCARSAQWRLLPTDRAPRRGRVRAGDRQDLRARPR
jgi:hypothetical protein